MHTPLEEVETDKRYRIMVILARSDRPKHYKFHCQRCGKPVLELVGTDVKAISDVIDMENKPMVGIRCNGSYWAGTGMTQCRIYYYLAIEGLES